MLPTPSEVAEASEEEEVEGMTWEEEVEGTKGEPLGQGEDFPWDEHKQNFSMVFSLVWLSIWLSLLFEILFHALVLLVNLDIM